MILNNNVQIAQFVTSPREDVFDAFVNPEKLEKWCYPQGFTLSVPEMEARVGGKYRYIHSGSQGAFDCTGKFEEFIPNQKLITIDHVIDSSGKVLMDHLKTVVSFSDRTGGTEISIHVQGLNSQEEAQNCEQGWADCLINLNNFLMTDMMRSSKEGHGPAAQV